MRSTRSTRSPRSPTPCSSRATCSTPTAPRRRRTALRWQFGVLAPPGFGRAARRAARSRTEVLLEPRSGAALRAAAAVPAAARAGRSHDADGRPVDELGRRRRRRSAGTRACRARSTPRVPVDEPARARRAVELPVASRSPRSATRAGRRRPRRAPLPAADRADRRRRPTPLPGPVRRAAAARRRRQRLRLPPTARPARTALRTSLIAAHTLLAVDARARSSRRTDPPRVGAARRRRAATTGTPGPCSPGRPSAPTWCCRRRSSSHDHPQLAPESPTDLFDGTEIDEILSLRTLALTDEEKAEARATDPRAAAVVDAVDAMPPEMWSACTARSAPCGRAPADPDAVADPVVRRTDALVGPRRRRVRRSPRPTPCSSAASRSRKGSRVLLRPGRGGDAQDMFLAGLAATVQAVLHDVDGEVHVAVSVDGDPAAELQVAHGRFLYFRPDEIEVAAEWTRERVLVAGRRQRLPLRRRVRRRGRPPARRACAARRGARSPTSASAACTWPTSCSTATTRSSWSTPSARGEPPGTLYLLEHDLDGRRRRTRRSTRTAWTPAPCSSMLDRLARGVGVDGPSTGCSSSAASRRDLDEGIGLTRPWRRPSTRPRRRSSNWSAAARGPPTDREHGDEGDHR